MAVIIHKWTNDNTSDHLHKVTQLYIIHSILAPDNPQNDHNVKYFSEGTLLYEVDVYTLLVSKESLDL